MSTLSPWKTYLILLGLVSAVYYTVILLRFYRKELLLTWHRLSGSDRGLETGKQPVEIVRPNPLPEVSGTLQNLDVLTGQVERLCTTLTSSLKEAAQKEYTRQDLLLLLRITLKEYPGFSAQPFRSLVEGLILSECERYGFVPLNVVEREEMWKEVV